LALSLASGAGAQTAPDLYAATVAVTEQSNAELQRAASSGLREVLVRVSGQSDVPRNPALANALSDARRYLDQYRYERNATAEPGGLPWLARLRFSQNSVTQLLRGANLPVWSGNRPALLVWLVLDDGKGRQFVDEHSALAITLREQAQRRGLQLQFPNNFSAATLDDVWQMDANKLQPVAAAASGSVLLLGRVAQVVSGHWLGAWTLVINDGQAIDRQQAANRQTIENEGDNLPAYLAPSMDRVVDALARQYAVVASTATAAGASDAGMLLRVAGIESFNDYAALLAYLKQLGSIKVANPLQVRGTEVLLQVKLEGSAEQLARQLALDNRLLLESAPEAGDATQPNTLNYRWQAARS
jgi:hypothetical protein